MYLRTTSGVHTPDVAQWPYPTVHRSLNIHAIAAFAVCFRTAESARLGFAVKPSQGARAPQKSLLLIPEVLGPWEERIGKSEREIED